MLISDTVSLSSKGSVYQLWLCMNSLWGKIMSISTALGILYAVAQVLMPCLPPKPLSSEVLSTDRVRNNGWLLPNVGSDYSMVNTSRHILKTFLIGISLHVTLLWSDNHNRQTLDCQSGLGKVPIYFDLDYEIKSLIIYSITNIFTDISYNFFYDFYVLSNPVFRKVVLCWSGFMGWGGHWKL